MLTHRSLVRLAVSLVTCLVTVAIPATSQGETVYATSFTNGSLVRFDSSNPGNSTTTVLGNGTFQYPTGLAFGSDGFLYVGVCGDFATIAPTIARVDLSNNSTTTAYTFASFDVAPAALVFRGNDLIVGRNPFFANTGPIVQLANMIGGTPTQGNYTTNGTLASSSGLALAADNTLYVANHTYSGNTSSGPVSRFDSAGAYLNEVITNGQTGGPPSWQLAGPTGLTMSGNLLYTSSIMNGQILVTNLTSNSTQLFTDAGFPYAYGPLALLSNGQLLSGDPSGALPSISQFATDGSLIGSYNLGLGQVGGIAVAPVPEPGTLGLIGVGFVGAFALLQSRRRATMTA